MEPVTRNEESGAVLILAVVFMVVVAFMLMALLNLSSNDLLNTSNLLSEQSLEYSARRGHQRRHPERAVQPDDVHRLGPELPAGSSSITLTYTKPIYVDCVSVTNPAPPRPAELLPAHHPRSHVLCLCDEIVPRRQTPLT